MERWRERNLVRILELCHLGISAQVVWCYPVIFVHVEWGSLLTSAHVEWGSLLISVHVEWGSPLIFAHVEWGSLLTSAHVEWGSPLISAHVEWGSPLISAHVKWGFLLTSAHVEWGSLLISVQVSGGSWPEQVARETWIGFDLLVPRNRSDEEIVRWKIVDRNFQLAWWSVCRCDGVSPSPCVDRRRHSIEQRCNHCKSRSPSGRSSNNSETENIV